MTHTALQPVYRDEYSTLYHGDSLHVLRSIPSDSFDAVITDPPYSSGGMTRSDRTGQGTSAKYIIQGTELERPEFYGDNRDQRGFLAWASLWLSECHRIVRTGGYLLTFIDWRQLPTMTDAIQAGGFVWRGIVPWDKTEASKPQMGWFRAQCEYVLLGSKGSLGKERDRAVRICAPGIIRKSVPASAKFHMTGKPVEVLHSLLTVLPDGARVLDPFAGGGTTLVAARERRIYATSIELSRDYVDITIDRLKAVAPVLL